MRREGKVYGVLRVPAGDVQRVGVRRRVCHPHRLRDPFFCLAVGSEAALQV